MSRKTSLFVRSEVLELFVNTLTADVKYSRRYRENYPQPIQMQLSKKPKTSQIFIAFLKSASNCEHFEKKKKKKKKKDERNRLSISETPNKFLKGLVSEHPSAVIVLSFRKNFLIPWFSKDKSFSFIFPFNQV